MRTYVVSVGRSLGASTAELPIDVWAELQRLVRSAMNGTGAALVFDGCGLGRYEGVTEDSAALIAVGELSAEALAHLRCRLADLAGGYGQESIALTIGTTEFVAGS